MMNEENRIEDPGTRSFGDSEILNRLFHQIKSHQFTSSPIVDEQLAKIISLLLRDFVASWYTLISDDTDFIQELIRVISYIIRELERRLSRVDWIAFTTRDIPEAIQHHIVDYRNCCEKIGTAYSGGLKLEELFHGCQPHIAMSSEESEVEYLRRISEILLDTLLPPEELKSETVKYLIREILTNNVLLMITNVLSDPDFLNYTILKSFDSEEYDESPQSGDISSMHQPVSTDREYESYTTNSSSYQHSLGKESRASDHSIMPDRDNVDIFNKKGSLFRMKQQNNSSFLRLRKRRQSQSGSINFPSNVVSGINKLALGGLGKVTSGIDKFKGIISQDPNKTKNPAKKFGKFMSKRKSFDYSGQDASGFKYQNPLPRRRRIGEISPERESHNQEQVLHSPSPVTPSTPKSSSPLKTFNYQQPLQQQGSTVSFSPSISSRRLSEPPREITSESEGPPDEEAEDSTRPEETPMLKPSEEAQYFEDSDSPKDLLDENEGESPVKADSEESLSIESKIIQRVRGAFSFVYGLYRESRNGPWILGPIDTTKYDRYHLEEPLFDLVNEAFQFHTHQKWIFTQFMFFVRPFVHAIATPVINRLVMKTVHGLISEDQIAFFLLSFRMGFWPNNYPVLMAPQRSEREKLEIRMELESNLLAYLSPYVSRLLGENAASEQLSFLFNMFQNQVINKHFIFILYDLILAHLVPEVVEARPVTEDTQDFR